MTLPFIRQYPNGRRALAEVNLFPAVESLGREFIAKGGAYVCEILPSGRARLAACLLVDGEQKDVEESEVDNGPGLLDAVSDLVGRSVKHLGETEH